MCVALERIVDTRALDWGAVFIETVVWELGREEKTVENKRPRNLWDPGMQESQKSEN